MVTNVLFLNRHIVNRTETFVAKLAGASESEILAFKREIKDMKGFRSELALRLREFNACQKPIAELGGVSYDVGEILYELVRAVRPNHVIETGTGNGISSSFILYAMHRNNLGELWSIDLPQKAGIRRPILIPNGQSPGWVIPEWLRRRLHLVLEASKTSLPRILDRLGSVDFFFHDSDHSYQNMSYEFRTVWPFLSTSGIILSHDVLWNTAFIEIARASGRIPFVFYQYRRGHVGGITKG